MSLVKRQDASNNLLDFLIWAVISLFGVRLFLQIFDNPIIGRGNWHIAHVLWGGLFMLIGIIVLIVFYGKSSIRVASIFGGIGWGLFIDEIGKYITKDNNYWFRPAIAFIYISFILIFFLYRILEKKTKITSISLWHELFEDFQEIINQDLEIKEKKAILKNINNIESLSLTPTEKKIIISLKTHIYSIKAKKDRNKLHFRKFIAFTFKTTYNRLFRKKMVFYTLLFYSLWYIGDKLYDLFILLINQDKIILLQEYYRHYDFFSRTDVFMISSKFFIEIIVTIFLILGFYYFVGKKTIKGIKFFQWSMLINIFLGAPIKFYFEQFSAVFSLILSIYIFSWLKDYYQEKLLKL
jgi:hypothetical protein